MLQHDDEQQDADMIKKVLQKVINEMDSLESDRISPHDEPKEMGLFMGAGIEKPNENKAETMNEAEPETQENQHEPLDHEVLNALLEQAKDADDEGATEDDRLDEFDPEVASLLRKRKHA